MAMAAWAATPTTSCSARSVNTSGFRMAEEQAADHFAGARDHRHGEVAAHRQVALRHAVVRRHRAVARILGDVGGAHDAFAA